MSLKPILRFFCLILMINSATPVMAASLTKITGQLSHPWGMDFLTEDELLITERPGGLVRVNWQTGSRHPIQNLEEVLGGTLYDVQQGGLLDILIDQSDDGPRLYLCFARRMDGGAATALLSARLDNDKLTDTSLLFTSNSIRKGGRHFGCRLAIDGAYLFMSIGDRGQREDAQDPRSHSGAVVRLDKLTGAMAGSNSQPDWDPALFSKGHRNPQGMAIHPETGDIWVHEHGPKGGDEINQLQSGANYGWPVVSHGKEYFGGPVGEGKRSAPGFVDPLWVWVPSIAPSGMAFYSGDMFPELEGDLLVGSLKFRSLYAVSIEAGVPVREEILLKQKIGRIRDVAIAPDGSILLLNDSSNGGLFRLSQ